METANHHRPSVRFSLVLMLYYSNRVLFISGAPIEVNKIANPTNEQVEELHSKSVKSLITLFEEYKYKYLENLEDKYLELQ
jgi:hypothetical protein